MPPYRIFYTGRPGVGKSTIVSRVKDIVERLGCRVGGFLAPESRGPSGGRVGFYIVDVATGERGWLARIGYPGPRIGRYGVVVEDAVRIGVGALRRALREADVIVLDEIGPMELAVPELRSEIIEVLASDKPIVGVVHRRLKSRDPDIYRIIRESSTIIEVTLENRDQLLGEAESVARRLCSGSTR